MIGNGDARLEMGKEELQWLPHVPKVQGGVCVPCYSRVGAGLWVRGFGTQLGVCKVDDGKASPAHPWCPVTYPWCSFAPGAELSPLLFPFAKRPDQNKLSQMATNPLDNLRLLRVPTPQGNSSFASAL